MFNSNRKSTLLMLAVLFFLLNTVSVSAQETELSSISNSDLPINVANQVQSAQSSAVSEKNTDSLISPSDAKIVAESEQVVAEEKVNQTEASSTAKDADKSADASKVVQKIAKQTPQEDVPANNASELKNEDSFDFDLKMKSAQDREQSSEGAHAKKAPADNSSEKTEDIDSDVVTSVQYKVSPVENLGNSVLSRLDDDLFSQMSEIEKSTTLLTLELRREKIRNEIEAQKAIRRKNAEEIERQKAEEKLKELEKRKQIEAQVIREQQILADKERLIEVLKQRKLINAYMNQMLVMQQDWLKEKESLYAQLDQADEDKKAIIASFKQKIDKVLEASAKNIQVAEEAKANFERIIKALKTRNEQLKKRIEADALIIKNAKSSLYLKSQSIEELKDKNAALMNAEREASASAKLEEAVDGDTEDSPVLLSSEYAILGIVGQANKMSVDLIDSHGQSVSLKVGSFLPTGHIVSEIGDDFVRFNKDGHDDYLYIGRSIDGITPTLGLLKDSGSK